MLKRRLADCERARRYRLLLEQLKKYTEKSDADIATLEDGAHGEPRLSYPAQSSLLAGRVGRSADQGLRGGGAGQREPPAHRNALEGTAVAHRLCDGPGRRA
jgi:hypothetical protein